LSVIADVRALRARTASLPPPGDWRHILHSPLLRQFAKFCLVGVTSTLIDLSAFAFLRGQHVPRLLANTLAFLVAVTNGFFWNRRWTFRAADRKQLRCQYLSFLAVSIGGFLLNTGILFLAVEALTATGVPARRAEMIGKIAAVPVVAIWNFTASKVWAFAGASAGEEEETAGMTAMQHLC
jgi:putative flippase GtrA